MYDSMETLCIFLKALNVSKERRKCSKYSEQPPNAKGIKIVSRS